MNQTSINTINVQLLETGGATNTSLEHLLEVDRSKNKAEQSAGFKVFVESQVIAASTATAVTMLMKVPPHAFAWRFQNLQRYLCASFTGTEQNPLTPRNIYGPKQNSE